MQLGRDFKMGKRLFSNEIWKDRFNKILDSLTENHSVKCTIISNRECLSLPKDSELRHRSIQHFRRFKKQATKVHEIIFFDM